MNTFEEIIEFAIKQEEESADFYRGLAERAKKPSMQKVFEELVSQEEGHKKRLESVLTKHKAPESKLTPDPDLKIADYQVEFNANKGEISYQDALILAMKRELAAQQLYQDLINKTSNVELKEILQFILEEEKKHKHSLEAEYDDKILTEN